MLGGSFSGIALLLFLLGASYGIIYLVNADYALTVASYHTTMAYGVLFVGFGFSLSFYLFSIIIENARQIVAALALAVLSAGLPFIIDYLLGGELNISGVREAIFAGSGGLTVALITAVTSHVKKTLNE